VGESSVDIVGELNQTATRDSFGEVCAQWEPDKVECFVLNRVVGSKPVVLVVGPGSRAKKWGSRHRGAYLPKIQSGDDCGHVADIT
jgi:hypothetical protein